MFDKLIYSLQNLFAFTLLALLLELVDTGHQLLVISTGYPRRCAPGFADAASSA
jgi:hypothetical protein